MFFSTIFQSYHDNGKGIMEGCVQWNPIYGLEDFALSRAGTKDRQVSRPAHNLPRYQGSVVQSIVSLTSSLRCQLVKCFTTL